MYLPFFLWRVVLVLLSGLVHFISFFSFFFPFSVLECNCECAHHLEMVLLEVISSQQLLVSLDSLYHILYRSLFLTLFEFLLHSFFFGLSSIPAPADFSFSLSRSLFLPRFPVLSLPPSHELSLVLPLFLSLNLSFSLYISLSPL